MKALPPTQQDIVRSIVLQAQNEGEPIAPQHVEFLSNAVQVLEPEVLPTVHKLATSGNPDQISRAADILMAIAQMPASANGVTTNNININIDASTHNYTHNTVEPQPRYQRSYGGSTQSHVYASLLMGCAVATLAVKLLVVDTAQNTTRQYIQDRQIERLAR